MSYKVKGSPLPIVTNDHYEYDIESGAVSRIITYEGSPASVSGLFTQLQDNTSAASMDVGDGIGRVTTRMALGKSGIANPPIRYEIATEVVEKEIWEHPAIIAAAEAYDTTLGDLDASFRTECESAAETSAPASLGAIGDQVVQMLKNGIKGWEYEYVVLRRQRKIPNRGSKYAPSPLTAIGEVQYIYTTQQLLLPSQIAFSVPDSSTLTARNGYSMWGWRRRPSQVTYDGEWIEQSGEFILAEWDNLLYEASPFDAAW